MIQCRVFGVAVFQAFVVKVVFVESAQGRNGAFVKLFVFMGDLGAVSVNMLVPAWTVKFGGEVGVMGLVAMAFVGAVVITVRGWAVGRGSPLRRGAGFTTLTGAA